ncbi:MAG TPA: M17 family peptidase N-terminal domain-containing protein [Candidatus Krumholzibacteria bacterium]|nr:M17 family peptidase N-terminal domain-containing protein [Candidatus Krumholzibacteria bacterium]
MIASVVVRAATARLQEQAIVIPLYRGTRRLPAQAPFTDRTVASAAAALLNGFAAKRGETRTASVPGAGGKLTHVIVAGLGDRTAATPEDIADAAGAAANALARTRAATVAIAVDPALDGATDAAAILHALLKGWLLAGYSYKVGARRKTAVRKLVVVSAQPARILTPTVRRARLIAGLVNVTRDWVNTPANDLPPAALADAARALCKEHGVGCRVMGPADIRKAAMGGVLAVSVGSRAEPRFVVMEYNLSRRDLPLVCLVGKGVTFDSGGISIKPWEKMNEMKGDMAGGAAVVAALAACAQLELPLRVVGLVPCVENMPGGAAFRPGDVLRMYSGKTVEVLSTDAEGRLILADAVAYGVDRYRPDVVVDIATLTGGAIIALGTRVAPIMGTDPGQVEAVRAAGAAAGEPAWPLPLDERYFDLIRGEISDYKNYGGRGASPITGGAMIGAFAGTTPWVHIDIAGPGWNDGGGASYYSRGGTGFGVDLLVRFLESTATG